MRPACSTKRRCNRGSAEVIERQRPARSAGPYLGALLLSALIDLLLRARLFFDLDMRKVLEHSLYRWLLELFERFYFGVLAIFLLFFLIRILPAILGNRTLSRGTMKRFGALATIQLLANLAAVNMAIFLVDIASYELLIESLALYASINLIFLFWYWFFDYPLRSQRLVSVGAAASGISGNRGRGIPLGILFPEEALELDIDGSDFWTPKLVDYVFFTLVSSNTLGSPEGHGVIGDRLKWTQIVHTICMTLVFIVIVARAINTLT